LTLWSSLAADPRHVDDLAGTAAIDSAEVLVALTDLELRGLVRQVAGMRFKLANAEVGTRNAEQPWE
jgi:predicted Rossmann fold nucleotide-binding protein DprA/Smf involved in DNA uptake